MTREEAKDKMLTESVQYKNGLRTVALRKINKFIDKIFDEHEEQLKAKDKEIERLNSIVELLDISSSGFHDLYTDYKRLARSIVAMLFWKAKELRHSSDGYVHSDEEIENAYHAFDKAYKILKDNA